MILEKLEIFDELVIDKKHMFAFLWAIIKNILDKISSDHVRIIFDMQTLIWFVELSEILK